MTAGPGATPYVASTRPCLSLVILQTILRPPSWPLLFLNLGVLTRTCEVSFICSLICNGPCYHLPAAAGEQVGWYWPCLPTRQPPARMVLHMWRGCSSLHGPPLLPLTTHRGYFIQQLWTQRLSLQFTEHLLCPGHLAVHQGYNSKPENQDPCLQGAYGFIVHLGW